MSELTIQEIGAVIDRESSEEELPSRVGLDLGSSETRIALPPDPGSEGPSVLTVPTVLGYSRPEAEPIRFTCMGEKALERRDHLQLVNPLETEPEKSGQTLRDYAGHIRGLIRRRYKVAPWGVVNCPVGASDEVMSVKRTVANELFDRVLFVDDTFLLAVGIASQEVCSHSVIVDVGTHSIRAALMYGEAPKPEERVEVSYGGARVDEALRESLSLRYPELLLTPRTLTQIKRELSFVAPAKRRALLNIEYRGAVKTVDLSDVVQDACYQLVRPLLKATRAILAQCPSDEIESFQRNILLVGGGAEIPGIVQRVAAELRADGFELAKVHKPKESTQLVAKGAGRWARMLAENEWAIPLFSFSGQSNS